jgi:WD40 repeat protein
MCVDKKSTLLFASDNNGYIYHWNIDGYGFRKEEKPPVLLKSWRAHTQNITSIDYIESSQVLITSSVDQTIRTWTPDGKYIGTFGQEEVWNLYDPKTFKHPLVPYDILVDNESIPQNKIYAERETMQEVLERNKAADNGVIINLNIILFLFFFECRHQFFNNY